MPRGLSSTIKAYAGPVHWIADLTALDGAVYRFWTGDASRTIAGQTYLPYLRITTGFRKTRSLQVDSGEIALINVDQYIAGVLRSKTLAGGQATVQQYLFGMDQVVHILTGRLADQEELLEEVRYRVTSEFEPAELDTLALEYSALCRWRFAKPPCGYLRASITVTENLSEQTADIHTASTIGKASLSMTVDAHIDRTVLITAGTGKGQHRRIVSNTATTLTIDNPWKTTPDGTSKFRVVTAPDGVPKQLFTSSSALDIATASVHTARTIGLSTLSMGTNEHASTGPPGVAAVVRIVAGTGSGQERKIGSNTATTITIATSEADFSPVPDGTSQFRVLYQQCPKDIGEACEQRGRTHRFNGAPTVSPDLSRAYGTTSGGAGGGTGPGGGGGGDDRDDSRFLL